MTIKTKRNLASISLGAVLGYTLSTPVLIVVLSILITAIGFLHYQIKKNK